jgi:hypothetical protein
MILWNSARMSKHEYFSFGRIVGLWPGSMLLAFATLGITTGSAEENSSPPAVSQSPSSTSALVREIAGFKSLADQIKIAFAEGRTVVAKAKIKELEASWEQVEPRLHLKYPNQSQILDQSLDRVIVVFSRSSPDPKQASSSLDQLIAIMSQPVHQTGQLKEETRDGPTNDWYAPQRSPGFNDLFGS